MITSVDARGEPVSGASQAAIALYEQALDQFQCYSGDPLATLEQAVADSPDFVMGQCFRAYLYLLSTEAAAAAAASMVLDGVAGVPTTARERRHLVALQQLLKGAWDGGISALENVLLDYPRDALALQALHLADFYVGDARGLRDHVARVLPEWSSEDPGYHALLGMYAFGLEETGDYARAEATGRRALEFNPRNAWAQHAVAHVMEMQGRAEEGIDWMAGRVRFWADDNFFAVHNWWHLALFHLDLDATDAVLQLYDQQIRADDSTVVLDLVDATALLWRLHLRDVDLGSRWVGLAERWAPLAGDAHYAFNDAHAMMAFVAGGRQWEAESLMAAQQRAISDKRENARMTWEVGYPVCSALRAFGREDYATCISLLRPLRHRLNRFGGSHAQRDIFDLTLLEAARRDGHYALLRQLANERLSLKPASPLNRRYRRDAVRWAAQAGGVAAL
jgi:tetratricopeptide (TPR) repeat protein